MEKLNIEAIKSDIEKKISSEDFQGLTGYFTSEEQMVLLILIRVNSALSIRTIRNFMVEILKEKYRIQILNKYNFYDPSKAIIEVPVRDEKYYMRKEKTFGLFEKWKKVPYYITEYPEETRKQMISTKSKENQIKFLHTLIERSKLDKKLEFQVKLYESLLEDDDLLKEGIKPLSYSNKVKLWEKALKGMAYVPSWNIIKSSINNLLSLSVIKERNVIKKKAEVFYFVYPLVYSIWKKSKERIHKLVQEKKYKPDEAENDWFF